MYNSFSHIYFTIVCYQILKVSDVELVKESWRPLAQAAGGVSLFAWELLLKR